MSKEAGHGVVWSGGTGQPPPIARFTSRYIRCCGTPSPDRNFSTPSKYQTIASLVHSTAYVGKSAESSAVAPLPDPFEPCLPSGPVKWLVKYAVRVSSPRFSSTSISGGHASGSGSIQKAGQKPLPLGTRQRISNQPYFWANLP